MNKSRRKPRPLNRDKQSFRDDRIYIIACDDTYAPKQYFEAYEGNFLGKRLQVHVIPTQDGTSSAEHVLNRLLNFESEERDEKWLFLDTDHYIRGSHQKSYIQAIQKAKQQGVKVAVSRPCFEFWLLLHHLKHNDENLSKIGNAKSASQLLECILGSYNKYNLNMQQFLFSTVPHAIVETRALDESVKGGDIPDLPTSRVYKLWESIIQNASLPQLPEELQPLKK